MERIEAVACALKAQGLSLSVVNRTAGDEEGILIDVVEVGDISDATIRVLLSAIFSTPRVLKNTRVVLKDDERRFDLPDDMEECIAWFVMEK